MEEVCARYEKLNETKGVFDVLFAGYEKRVYTVCYIVKNRFLISCSMAARVYTVFYKAKNWFLISCLLDTKRDRIYGMLYCLKPVFDQLFNDHQINQLLTVYTV